MLLVSFVMGIIASLKEQRLENQVITTRRSNWELAKMCIITNEIPRVLDILNRNRSARPSKENFWKYYILISMKDLALLLFFLGIIGIAISLFYDLPKSVVQANQIEIENLPDNFPKIESGNNSTERDSK